MTRHERLYVYDRTGPTKRQPPPQRAKVLAFIQAEITAGRPFPGPTAIAQHMGWSQVGSAKHCLTLLIGDGWIKRTVETSDGDGRPRNKWELVA